MHFFKIKKKNESHFEFLQTCKEINESHKHRFTKEYCLLTWKIHKMWILAMNREGIYWDTQLLFHDILITPFDEPTSAIIICKWDPRHGHLGSFKPEPLSFRSIMSSRRAPISGVKWFAQSPISPFLKYKLFWIAIDVSGRDGASHFYSPQSCSTSQNYTCLLSFAPPLPPLPRRWKNNPWTQLVS